MRLPAIYLVIFILLSSCVGRRIRTYSAKDIAYDKYHTFYWLQGSYDRYQGPSFGSESVPMAFVQQAIEEELLSKKLLYDSVAPQLLITYQVNIDKEELLLTHPENFSPIKESLHERQKDINNSKNVYAFLKGSLTIDVIDAESCIVIWRSVSQRYMSSSPKYSQKRIKKGIAKALNSYPSH